MEWSEFLTKSAEKSRDKDSIEREIFPMQSAEDRKYKGTTMRSKFLTNTKYESKDEDTILWS